MAELACLASLAMNHIGIELKLKINNHISLLSNRFPSNKHKVLKEVLHILVEKQNSQSTEMDDDQPIQEAFISNTSTTSLARTDALFPYTHATRLASRSGGCSLPKAHRGCWRRRSASQEQQG
jgi:hypothetical protein